MFTRFALKAVLASTIAAAATFAAMPAHAELGAPRSVAVSYADLDLKSETGQNQLRKRIAFAAETVCGPADTLSYHSRKSVAGCRDRAIAGAQQGMVEVFAKAGSTIRVAAN
jgi:UrcA family protein